MPLTGRCWMRWLALSADHVARPFDCWCGGARPNWPPRPSRAVLPNNMEAAVTTTSATPRATRPRPSVVAPDGNNQHAPSGPAADIWALLDELAARGRALRQAAEGAAPAAAPGPDGSAVDGSAVGGGDR